MVEQTQHVVSDQASTEQWLKDHHIAFNTVNHEAVHTIPDMIEKVVFEGDYTTAKFAINLFKWDTKSKTNRKMWLICAAHDSNIDMKELHKALGVSNGKMRNADEDQMVRCLGCTPGGVNLFSILNDKANEINLVMDKRILEAGENSCDLVAFHPMVNTATTAISRKDVQKVIDISGHKALVLDFANMGSAVAAPVQKEAKPAKEQKPAEEKKQGRSAPVAAIMNPDASAEDLAALEVVKASIIDLKKEKAEKSVIDAAVVELKRLKAICEMPKAQPKPVKKAEKIADSHNEGIQYTKEENFSEWYQQVITKSDLIEYYDISGCYILRPRSFFIWEQIQAFMDSRFKGLGVQNAYFPMFVTEAALNKEKEHVEGFSPEVAWVTRSGQSEMKEPIAIRPTSETIMYPAYAKWIHSHRDLPLLINQWTNVVRWEFKHPTPFIRTREFLWQEGHTAHANKAECDAFVRSILNIYATTYQELLAVPVIKGRKSDDERFPGADNTETVELYVPVSGRGIQGATSHMLGNNFSKMFEINYQDVDGKSQMVWQASWGFSTRSIGAMIMMHSDNQGLVLPPKVAQTQVVVMPIISSKDDKAVLFAKCEEIGANLRASGLRVIVDLNEHKNPGYKFSLWELRGTPIRVEVGAKDMAKNEVKCVVRHNKEKFQQAQEGLAEALQAKMLDIHEAMFQKAVDARAAHMTTATTREEFMTNLNKKDIILAPFCDTAACEIRVKDWSKEESIKAMEAANEGEAVLTGSAKTLCIPFEHGKQDFSEAPESCLFCENPAKVTALWGRSY